MVHNKHNQAPVSLLCNKSECLFCIIKRTALTLPYESLTLRPGHPMRMLPLRLHPHSLSGAILDAGIRAGVDRGKRAWGGKSVLPDEFDAAGYRMWSDRFDLGGATRGRMGDRVWDHGRERLFYSDIARPSARSHLYLPAVHRQRTDTDLIGPELLHST